VAGITGATYPREVPVAASTDRVQKSPVRSRRERYCCSWEKVAGANYVVLAPKVDKDGNDVAGVRSTTIQAPLATYTGWNLRAAGYAEGELCSLTGSYIPFAVHNADRMASGDPRLALDERYGTHAGYVAAVTAAANQLVSQRYLLAEDAQRPISEAEAGNVLR